MNPLQRSGLVVLGRQVAGISRLTEASVSPDQIGAPVVPNSSLPIEPLLANMLNGFLVV